MNAYLIRVWLCVCAATAAALIVAAVPAQAQLLRKDGVLPALRMHEPFGLSFDIAPAGAVWTRWLEFESGVAQSMQSLAHCRADAAACTDAQTRFMHVIDGVRGVKGRAKLGLINRAINLSIVYTSDRLQHANADVWSSALTTFETEQGDCEDFAIAKYVALRAAGIAPQDLRLVVGRIARIGQSHAVVAARLDGRWLILDNRRMMMVEDIHAIELQPAFSFGDDGVRQYAVPAMQDNAGADIHTVSLPSAASAVSFPSTDK